MSVRPGVYKMSMVRMQVDSLPTNFRVYGSKPLGGRKCRNRFSAMCVGLSKTFVVMKYLIPLKAVSSTQAHRIT